MKRGPAAFLCVFLGVVAVSSSDLGNSLRRRAADNGDFTLASYTVQSVGKIDEARQELRESQEDELFLDASIENLVSGTSQYEDFVKGELLSLDEKAASLHESLAQAEKKQEPDNALAKQNPINWKYKPFRYSDKYEVLKEKAPKSNLFVTMVVLAGIVFLIFTKGYWPLVVSGEGEGGGIWGRLFLRHLNPGFADDYELAFRGAFFVIFVGIPLLVWQHEVEILHIIIREGLFTSSAVVYFIYTLYKSVGETVMFAWGGIAGTSLAVLNIWVLYGFFPVGVSEHASGMAFWVGLVDGTLFVIALLWLNVGMNTAVFGLSTWVYFWMAFLEPTPDEFSTAFQINFKRTAINCFLQCTAGCVIAILASLFPYPRYSLLKATASVSDIDEHLQRTWTNMRLGFEHGTLDENSEVRSRVDNVMLVEKYIKKIRSQVGTLRGDLEIAWWECFGFGSRQQIRLMIYRYETALYTSYDILAGISTVVSTNPSKHRGEMLRLLSGHTDELVKCGSELMAKCAAAAIDGVIDDDEAASLKASIEITEKAIEELTTEFGKAKTSLGCPGFSKDLVDEHIFFFGVCSFASLASSYAKDALAHRDGTKTLESFDGDSGFTFGVFNPDVLFEPSHVNYVLRNGLAILIGFAIGFKGYAQIVSAYNAEIAGIMSLLLSKFIGSAMTKNLGRLQGVVLGTIVGQTFYQLFGWCTWWGTLLSFATLFGWVYLTLFVYYNSKQYSFLGVLLAAFGASNMLKSCMAEGFKPETAYGTIVSTVLAIAMMLAIDIILSSERAADMAHASLQGALVGLKKAVVTHFDKDDKKLNFSKDSIMPDINNAVAVSLEADNEPRFYRVPWNMELFGYCTECIRSCRFCVSLMEMASMGSGNLTGDKHPVFVKLRDEVSGSNHFSKDVGSETESLAELLKSFVKEPMEMIELLMDVKESKGDSSFKAFLVASNSPQQEQEASSLTFSSRPAPKKFHNSSESNDFNRLLEEAGKFPIFSEKTAPLTHLAQDPAVQFSILVGCYREMMRIFEKLENRLLPVDWPPPEIEECRV